MPIDWNEISAKSLGGTEQMAHRIEKSLPKDLLDNFQIIPSRVRELDESKVRILFLHDLPGDPESQHLAGEGWRKFHKIVFVSFWQREWYVRHFGIPYSRTCVMHNAIEPIPLADNRPVDQINLIYHTTPHRGLEILVPVFKSLAQKHKDIHLDVFSSFEVYGWGDRDKHFEGLFEEIKSDPNMTYHGYVPNENVRLALQSAHIFAYPNIWLETSCLSLIEAMSAQCYCVHPDYGALSETAANWTYMYPYHEDPNQHAGIFHQALDQVIDLVRDRNPSQLIKAQSAKSYCDLFYNWEIRKEQWEALLRSLVNLPREIEASKAMFHYHST